MATRTVGYDFRSEFGSQTVIAVFIAADTSAGDAEFLCQRHAFMTLRTTISRDGGRSRRSRVVERRVDAVNAVTVRAHRRTGHAAHDRLTVNALHELIRFGAMAFAARLRNVDPGNG